MPRPTLLPTNWYTKIQLVEAAHVRVRQEQVLRHALEQDAGRDRACAMNSIASVFVNIYKIMGKIVGAEIAKAVVGWHRKIWRVW